MLLALLSLVLRLATPPAQMASPAPVPEAWFGTWALNLSRSDYGDRVAPYTRATYTIEPWDGGLKVTYEMVYARGGWTRLEWSGRIDGRDYPVQGLDDVVTYAYRSQPDGSCEVIVKFDGRETARSHITLSPDGKTMTTKTVGRGAQGQPVRATTVYERMANENR